MTDSLIKTDDYKAFVQDIKQQVQSVQIKAAIMVNQALLQLYWDLAERIVNQQQTAAWGDGFLLQLSRDLQAEFPDMKGFSKRNLELMRQWYRFWSEQPAIAKQRNYSDPLPLKNAPSCLKVSIHFPFEKGGLRGFI